MNRPLRIGIGIWAAGGGPLILYALFGPAEGNPIGLGLLFFLSAPAGLACVARGLYLRRKGR